MASRSVNKVILIGRLGKDAETKFTPSGVARTTFTLATSYRYKDKQTGDWKEETDWHNVVLWRSENVANYLLKGKQIYIEGRLTSRSYDDKDGNKRYITEVVADEVMLLGGGGAEGGGRSENYGEDYGGGPVSMPRSARQQQPQPAAPAASGGGFEPGITDDDVPF